MAHLNDKRGVSTLPLRHTDLGGRLRLLREAGLVTGDVETGLRLMGDRTLLEVTELMDPPVENVIGAIPYQLGLATNFRINGREVLVPMAVREPTVIAGVSKAAKLALPEGFSVGVRSVNEITAEILFSGYDSVTEAEEARGRIRVGLEPAIRLASEKKGGRGSVMTGNILFISPDRPSDRPMLAVRLRLETGDRMGSLIATSLAERIAGHLETRAGRKRTAVICSNFRSGRTILAKAVWPWASVDRVTADGIIDLQRWAEKDPYRDATHCKGVMNGIMAVCRATGQDEEAVWSAARPGRTMVPASSYLTKYREGRDGLEGSLNMTLPIATRGGATRDPFARMCLALAGAEDARDLAAIVGAAGLAANFAALHCLVNEGITAAFGKVRQE